VLHAAWIRLFARTNAGGGAADGLIGELVEAMLAATGDMAG